MKKVICSFEQLSNINNNIIFFGAGVIGQVIAPEMIENYGIGDKIDCYIDNDSTKWNTIIRVKDKQLEVKSHEYLNQCDKNSIIIINISRYAQVLEQLEQMECTKEMTAIIMPS